MLQINSARAGALPLRLEYLDSLRALAAMAVVILHAFQIFGLSLDYTGPNAARGLLGDGWLDTVLFTAYHHLIRWGFYAVQVFIVISGFSLMLPVARSADLHIKGGVRTFLLRRARRILPPYYAALLVSLLMIALIPGLNTPANVYWDQVLPALQADGVIAHLLLVHNVPVPGDPYFGGRINPPHWSIAVEWQIYFLFPLLVWIWRRSGRFAALGAALLIGVVPPLFGLLTIPFSNGHFLALFAIGMLGASIAAGTSPRDTGWRRQVPCGLLIPGFLVAFVAASLVDQVPGIGLVVGLAKELFLGMAVIALLIYAARASKVARLQPWHLRLLQLGPLVRTGHFSYSIYLLHAPILASVAIAARGLPGALAYLAVLGVGIPLVPVLSYGFYRLFERPFMSVPAATTTR